MKQNSDELGEKMQKSKKAKRILIDSGINQFITLFEFTSNMKTYCINLIPVCCEFFICFFLRFCLVLVDYDYFSVSFISTKVYSLETFIIDIFYY